jgi:hypothetical protein
MANLTASEAAKRYRLGKEELKKLQNKQGPLLRGKRRAGKEDEGTFLWHVAMRIAKKKKNKKK